MMIKNSYNYRTRIDWWCIVIYCILICVGFLSVNSASYDILTSNNFSDRSIMQLIWILLSIGIGALIILIKKEIFYKISIPLYVLSIIINIALLFIGKEVNGAKSWIGIGSIGIQPSEFGKLVTALMLARVLSDVDFNIKSFGGIVKAISIIVFPMGVIVLQNDVGSALVYGGFAITLYLCGLNTWFYRCLLTCVVLFILAFVMQQNAIYWGLFLTLTIGYAVETRKYIQTFKYICSTLLIYTILVIIILFCGIIIDPTYVTLISIGITVFIPLAQIITEKGRTIYLYIMFYIFSCAYIGFIDYFFTNILKIHQQKRILDLLGLESDLKGWGYNVNQSMIAIGSGGFFGKGYMNGTQTKYNFVPEQTTDFVFCTIGEEGGFVVSSLIVLLFCTLIFRLLRMAMRTSDEFAKIYTFGVVAILTVHILVNIGMTIGLVPVIGIPLPFISYGGSSLISFTAMLFIAIKICAENKVKVNRYL